MKIDFVSDIACPWCIIGLKSLEQALDKAYFTDGLNEDRAREVVATNAYAEEVRAQEAHYLAQGIHSVPAIIINDRHLIQGGQPADVFETALRQIANA